MNASEQKLLDDVATHGCHVLHVLEEGDLPPFSYSVGIFRTCTAPELLVVGLERQLSHWVINEYHRRVRQGEAFEVGARPLGFLEGHAVTFREVHRVHYGEYLGRARWFYGSDDFPTLQLVWPSTTGCWPWDDGATPWFRGWQPILDTDKS
ncbi:MAG: DUF4262 domain-containing protein [Planctomycetota bacterium]